MMVTNPLSRVFLNSARDHYHLDFAVSFPCNRCSSHTSVPSPRYPPQGRGTNGMRARNTFQMALFMACRPFCRFCWLPSPSSPSSSMVDLFVCSLCFLHTLFYPRLYPSSVGLKGVLVFFFVLCLVCSLLLPLLRVEQ